MTIGSVVHFLDILRDSRLLPPAQLEEVAGDLQARFPDPRALARELVQRGWLTPFQVNQLFHGRGQELVLGPYVLLERLGEGGMGQVFKARHQLMNRLVALKLIRKERLSNPDSVRRFYREVQAVGQLSHPNIVIAHDAAQFGDTHVFVMEHVDGVDLARVIKQRGALPPGEAADYIRQAALGLEHAYENGMVHRDIKPANLLVASRGGVVKVLDMGLARLAQSTNPDETTSQLTQEGSVMGTPDYIAPEQALDSHTVDIRSDIYSLGCTLYHLLAGQPPFPGGTLGEKLVKHQLKEPTPVEQVRPEVPAALAGVVRKMMAKRPADRYQTPLEVAQALAPFSRAGGLPGLAAGGPRSSAEALLPIASATRTEPEGMPRALPVTPPGAFPSALPVPIILDYTIDPTAPMAVPLSGTLPRPGAWQRLWILARRRPLPAVLVGLGVLSLLVLVLVLALRPGPARPPVKEEPQGPLMILGGKNGRHWGPVRCVAFHPTEKLAASGGDDQAVRVWDAETLEEKYLFKGTQGAVYCLAFSPRGKFLVAGCADGSLRLYDLGKRKEVRRFPGNSGVVYAVSFAPSGTKILAGTGSGTLLVFDTETGRPLTPAFAEGSGPVASVAFSPDGSTALSAGADKIVRLWDMKKYQRLKLLEGHTAPVLSVAFSPDGKQALSGGDDKTVRLWDLKTGKPAGSWEGHAGSVTSVAFAHDGARALSASADGSLRLWEVAEDKGKELHRFEGLGGVQGAAFSRDDRRALSAGQDHLVRLWDLKDYKELVPRAGHTHQVQNVAISPNSRFLVSAGSDHTVRFWDLSTGKPLATPVKVDPSAVPCLAFSADSSQVLFATGDRYLFVRDPAADQSFWTVRLEPSNLVAGLIPIQPGNQYLGWGGYGYAYLLDSTRGAFTRNFASHMAAVESVALSPDGHWGLSGGQDWKIWLFDLAGIKPPRPFAGHRDQVMGVAFTSDGKHFLSVGADHLVFRWDVEGKGRKKLFELPWEKDSATGKEKPPFTQAVFSPDSKLLAACDDNGRIRLWDVASGKLVRTWENSGPVLKVVFTADGKRLAAANANGTVALYAVPHAAAGETK